MSNNRTQEPLSINYQQQVNYDDEIDLLELLSLLYKEKLTIVICTFIFALGGVIYALSQSNTYKSEAILVSAVNEKGGSLSGLASQFGGIASLAGINIGSSGGDKKKLALATLNSRQFIQAFINKYNLLIPLMASKKWDPVSEELILDKSIFDHKKEQWLGKITPPRDTAMPTDWDAYKKFKEIFRVNEDKNGLITISITHHSPIIAQQWLVVLVNYINEWIKNKDKDETNKNIEYLERELEHTNVTHIQTILYQLIEEQIKNKMLAEVQDEYAFKLIDPPVIPQEKAGPKRALICAISTILGLMIGVFFVFGQEFVRKNKEK